VTALWVDMPARGGTPERGHGPAQGSKPRWAAYPMSSIQTGIVTRAASLDDARFEPLP
jgi:hypothetical protein